MIIDFRVCDISIDKIHEKIAQISPKNMFSILNKKNTHHFKN